MPILAFIMPILAFLIYPVFLKRSPVFCILLFFFFPYISLHCSLKKAFLSLLAILRNSTFSWRHLSLSPLPFISLLSSAMCKVSSDNHLAFLHFFFFGMVLPSPSIQCYELQSIDLEAHCLPDLIPCIYLSPLYNNKGFDLGDS